MSAEACDRAAQIKIYRPRFWSLDSGVDYSAPVIHLNDIVPAVGQKTFAFFDRDDRLEAGATILLIWCPPVSDLNGWSEQPSEIAQSHFLKAHVVGAAHASPHSTPDSDRKYELEILSCERLLPALQASRGGSTSWNLQGIGSAQGSFLAWDELHWCGRAVVEGFTYLTANTSNEAHLELILEESGDELIGLFSVHIDPGGTFHEMGRKRLTGEERRVIQQALKLAHPLHDSQAAYLVQ
ncbi:hypothetical protein [Pseudomonas frederiksbergensis]|uniref:hypothetical protein n=1 Tax=Pseudomonas frederiksbergensis TaxID=104087 RepID=UPI003D2066B6